MRSQTENAMNVLKFRYHPPLAALAACGVFFVSTPWLAAASSDEESYYIEFLKAPKATPEQMAKITSKIGFLESQSWSLGVKLHNGMPDMVILGAVVVVTYKLPGEVEETKLETYVNFSNLLPLTGRGVAVNIHRGYEIGPTNPKVELKEIRVRPLVK